MSRKMLFILFTSWASLCVVSVSLAVTLDTSGTYPYPVYCHEITSIEASFNMDRSNYTFQGYCDGNFLKGPYIIAASWKKADKKALEVVQFVVNSNPDTTHEAYFTSTCTDDPWLNPSAQCSCVATSGSLLGLVAPNCPFSPTHLRANQIASLNQQYQQYFGTPPETPLNLTAETTSITKITLTWQDVSNKEEGFSIERKKEGETTPHTINVEKNTTSYTDSDLAYNTTYHYRIRSYFNSMMSDYSNEAVANTQFFDPDLPNYFKYHAPTDLSAEYDTATKTIHLEWKDNATIEGGFKIDRKKAGGPYVIQYSVPQNSTSYDDGDYESNTTYTYRVCAFREGLESTEYSNEASATTPIKEQTGGAKPDQLKLFHNAGAFSGFFPPMKFKIKVLSSESVKLIWIDKNDNEMGYKIERKTEGGSYVLIKTTAKDEEQFIDQNLQPQTVYYYRIKAFTSDKESPYSKEIKVQTKGKKASAKKDKSVKSSQP
ncbi:fibronectin type III domain-containing protein [bacterium]|nr:fibronectin type III domain-containing protein [bacterium]